MDGVFHSSSHQKKKLNENNVGYYRKKKSTDDVLHVENNGPRVRGFQSHTVQCKCEMCILPILCNANVQSEYFPYCAMQIRNVYTSHTVRSKC